jgi:DNA polymerase III gamma/tau subunit
VLAKQLIHIAKKEGFALDEASALTLAKQGKGSYRDALGILEQALTRTEGKVVGQEIVKD